MSVLKSKKKSKYIISVKSFCFGSLIVFIDYTRFHKIHNRIDILYFLEANYCRLKFNLYFVKKNHWFTYIMFFNATRKEEMELFSPYIGTIQIFYIKTRWPINISWFMVLGPSDYVYHNMNTIIYNSLVTHSHEWRIASWKKCVYRSSLRLLALRFFKLSITHPAL